MHMDQDCILEDPGVLDAEKGDFPLKADSPPIFLVFSGTDRKDTAVVHSGMT